MTPNGLFYSSTCRYNYRRLLAPGNEFHPQYLQNKKKLKKVWPNVENRKKIKNGLISFAHNY
jgi:hypothetical protein